MLFGQKDLRRSCPDRPLIYSTLPPPHAGLRAGYSSSRMKRILTMVAIAAWVTRLCAAQATSDCRLYLADQSDWGNNVGFYMDVEATVESEGVCHLSTLTMF